MDDIRRLSGLEIFQRIIAGELPPPPIGETLGFKLAEAEDGRVIFTATPQLRHYNPIGSVHGGFAATLLDSAMSCAVQTKLAAGQGYTTVEMKISYLRPLTHETGPVRSIGETIQVGRRIGIAEGRLVDAGGKLYAHGTTTCLIFSLP